MNNNIQKNRKKRLARSPWEKFRQNKLAMIGLAILMIIVIFSFLAPVISPYERDKQNLLKTYKAPSSEHLLGTDELGRDVLTRLLHGGIVSLSVGVASTFISVMIGVLLGAIAGYFSGIADMVIMRIVDIFMCFPFYVIAIALAAIIGPSIWNVMFITGLLSWTSICRIVRAEVLSIKEREFIEVGHAIGLSHAEMITRHVLPNVLSSIIVYATLGVASGILSEAGLSYLGLGVKQPQPSWGNMLASAQNLQNLSSRIWLWVPPGIVVFLVILAINFVGDGLRDALDPKQL